MQQFRNNRYLVENVVRCCATQKKRSGMMRRDDCLSVDVTPRIFIEKRRGGNMFP
jgi:hypothetical protein